MPPPPLTLRIKRLSSPDCQLAMPWSAFCLQLDCLLRRMVCWEFGAFKTLCHLHNSFVLIYCELYVYEEMETDTIISPTNAVAHG